MWIYYYASFGPGHQSRDYGFKYFSDNYESEDIKEYLFDNIDTCGYDISLSFWEVERPPAKLVERETKEVKKRIKNLRKHLKTLESITCFVSNEKEEKDEVIIRNIKGKIDSDIVKRLHKAGLMYSNSDINNWKYGKKYPIEPQRSKILSIIRISKSYS